MGEPAPHYGSLKENVSRGSRIWIFDPQLVTLLHRDLGDVTLLDEVTGGGLSCFKAPHHFQFTLCFLRKVKM